MAVFKYVTAETGLMYLNSWHLKYSVPSEFNDPFDALPTMTAEHALSILRGLHEGELPPSVVRLGLGGLVPASGWSAELLRLLSDHYAMLCLSRTGKHLLMWSHYADHHRGMLLEFDEEHPCFRRAHGKSTVLGRLHAVQYSDERPVFRRLVSRDVQTIYTTKSLEWAHEQEMRLLWPVKLPDKRDGEHLLLSVPPAALRRVVLGCRCASATAARVRTALEADAAAHVVVHKATQREADFGLDYRPHTLGLGDLP